MSLIGVDDLGVIAEVVASQSFVSEFKPSDNERLDLFSLSFC
jgi:hypothetical protein